MNIRIIEALIFLTHENDLANAYEITQSWNK